MEDVGTFLRLLLTVYAIVAYASQCCTDCRLQRGVAGAERRVETRIHVPDTGEHLPASSQRPQHHVRTSH